MAHPATLPILDGHNDTVLRLLRGATTAAEITAGGREGHIDLPRARAGGFAGGFFAMYCPSAGEQADRHAAMQSASYDIPLPAEVPQPVAKDWTDRAFSALEALEAEGAIDICRNVPELTAAIHGPRMAAILHIEGAEAIDRDLEVLHAYHARGLRSLGPVWSRNTIWGQGVPFRYPSSPDIGPGLTEAGKDLVRACNRLGIMIDLSHLNEKGFDDVARLSDAPLVATHSNAWEISPHARNLTDRQLAVIAETDGMVGVNFASAFLRPDGRMCDDFELDIMVRHFDHLLSVVGEDGVGFGSDFDGALVPRPIGDCAGLPRLVDALRAHGYDEALLTKLAHQNWVRVLERTWQGDA